ncbi:uncharacterized protein LOC135475838 isoform X2 [Liolophura sinensis]|uniref:uncharacterized protein LOC135475838 isoform X2 n=1 Tax=Liolophura sinensis TaxID=3198878 RepID=UPI003158CEBA
MSSIKLPADQVYNMSLCENYPEDYKFCQNDSTCRLYVAPCDPRSEPTRVNIEMAVIISAVFLCFVIFIVTNAIHRIRQAKQQSAISNMIGQVPILD